MTLALILTGPPGTGKLSVLEALTTLLEIDDLEFSALESEQLAWGSPWLSAGAHAISGHDRSASKVASLLARAPVRAAVTRLARELR